MCSGVPHKSIISRGASGDKRKNAPAPIGTGAFSQSCESLAYSAESSSITRSAGISSGAGTGVSTLTGSASGGGS